MWLAAWLQPELRRLFPQLRAAVQFREHALLVYSATPLWLWLIVSFRLHLAVPQRLTQAELITRLIKLHATGLAAVALLAFLLQSVINRSLVALFLGCSFALLYAQRSALIAWARYQYKQGTGQKRLLLVGSASERMAELVRSALAAPDPPHILGYLDCPGPQPTAAAPELENIGTRADLPRLLHEQAIDHVLFFPPANRPEDAHAELLACEEVGVAASFSIELVQLAEATPQLAAHYEHAFVTFEVAPKSEEALALKYTLDVLSAACLIVLLSPVFLLVALAILLRMSRPVFFVQERAGLHGRPFRMLKFRTMQPDAAAQQHALRPSNSMQGPVFKLHDDPRVTPLGRLLRRTSLDELPQLFNVVTGSMSLVGPRPLPLSEQAEIRGWQRRRLTMKPGLTCLWQVSGRSDTDFVDWMLLDLKYIQDWSLWLDLAILLRTLPVVLFGRGAR
jgi:exopolysaccharide biosynthesis polyprenyl glycosylphosphotransferase